MIVKVQRATAISPPPMVNKEDSDTSATYDSKELSSPNNTNDEYKGRARRVSVSPSFNEGGQYGYMHYGIRMEYNGLKSTDSLQWIRTVFRVIKNLLINLNFKSYT